MLLQSLLKLQKQPERIFENGIDLQDRGEGGLNTLPKTLLTQHNGNARGLDPIDEITRNTQMKAMICPRYGSPNVLQLREVDKPSPQQDEVLVKIHAASLNSRDLDCFSLKFHISP